MPAVNIVAGTVSIKGLFLNNLILEQEVHILVGLIEELSEKRSEQILFK